METKVDKALMESYLSNFSEYGLPMMWLDFDDPETEDGRGYRLFNVIDELNREDLTNEADFSLPAIRIFRALDQVIEWSESESKYVAIMDQNT